VPGSGSSLDLIGAAARVGIDFVLTRTETAAAIMASVTAELTGAPGVVVTGLGPGAAAVANGVAYAALDRAPLLVVTDTHPPAAAFASHQRFDHAALFAPLVKRSCAPTGATSAAELAALLDEALAPPRGPIHIDLSGPAAAETVVEGGAAEKAPRAGGRWDVAEARALLAAAERPVLLVGLEARRAPEAARALAADLGGPVLTTWKAKGVVADDDPLFVGLFAGGELEADCVGRADLIVQLGFDPIELIPQRWRYRAPVVDVGEAPDLPHYAAPAASLIGPLAEGAGALMGAARRGGWPAEEVRALRLDMARRQAMPASAVPGALGPRQVVEAAVAAAAPAGCRAAVDAGAHMFPIMALWPAREPNAVLISDGLATMGFALPAAIASALEEPGQPVVAFTGDGGLLMCLGELATAAERGCRIAVVVFDDAALSLIDANRTRRGLPGSGRSLPPVDFAAAARALGLEGCRAATTDDLRAALGRALDADGPTLIDVPVDPDGYPALLKALRG
jgi:acetolactate synthase-1/2/3 large subunit